MSDEDAFLEAIFAGPDDETTRLVYADWLEERGDPRAEFMRLDCQVSAVASPAISGVLGRLKEIALTLGPDWVALVRSHPVADAIEAALSRLEELVAGLNYVVGLDLVRVPVTPGMTVAQFVSAALGPGVALAGHHKTTGEEALRDVERCLRYEGGAGHGPDQAALRSREFDESVRVVLAYLQRTAAESKEVAAFSLRGVHAYRGSMWEFAYVFVKERYGIVFLGWSSD
jgi:uncharacterized protein (TIGR02996 family)